MKRGCIWSVCLLAWASALTPATAQVATRVAYTLLEGSYFVDDCLICGRPTILLPMRGTFDLVLQQNTAPYTRYAIQNLDFTAAAGASLEKHITGQGTYTRFEEFAILQDMTLATQVRDTWTNRPAYFTNNTRLVQQPFPLIQADLTRNQRDPAADLLDASARGAGARDLVLHRQRLHLHQPVRAHEPDQRRATCCPTAAGWSSGTASWWAGSGSCRPCRTWDWMPCR